MKSKLIALFILLVSFNFKSIGLEKSEYYSNQLKDLKVNLIPYSKSKGVYKIDKNKSLVTVSSELENFKVLEDIEFDNIYIICDKIINLKNIECNLNEVKSSNTETIGENDLNSINYTILSLDQKDIIFIPERYFIAPIYSRNLEILFKKTHYQGYYENNKSNNTSSLQKIKDSFYTEATILVLTAVFFSLLLSKILFFISNKNIEEIFSEIGNRIIDFANRNIWIYHNIALILFIFITIITLTYLTYKDLNVVSLLRNLSNYNSIEEIKNKVSNNILHFIALVIFMFTIIITFLISIYHFYKLKVLNNLQINLNKVLIVFISFIYISIFMNFFEYNKYQFINITITIFLITIIIYNKEIFKASFDKNKLFIFFISLLILNLGGGIVYYINSNKSNNINYSNLFNNNDIKLPYSKTNNKNIRYNDLFFNENKNIFINKYLVFSPTFTVIQHKNISEFKNSINENFYIISTDKNSMIKEYLENYNLVSYISSPSSNFYYLKSQNPKILFNIEFYCKDINKPFLVSLKYYYLEDNLKIKNQNLMTYTGCDYSDKLSYIIPFDTLQYNSPIIVELTSVPSNFSKLTVQTDNLNNELIPIAVHEGVIAKQANNKNIDTVNVYSPDINDEINFSRLKNEKFNLANPINTLLDLQFISPNFTIWTDNKYDNFINLN